MIAGIDFGTSTSEIACAKKDGSVEIFPNHLGETITPSVVYIEEDGTPLVGKEAREKALLDPDNAFIEVKRLFGSGARLSARGKKYSPSEVAAIIIRYLADCAEKSSGEKIDSAIITVPAYFTDAQRKEVIEAGEAAGLKVERILNEPTAASLDYGVNHMEDCDYILVYDLGGGTLDVTVLELFEGVVEVKSSCGNNALGGKDFDEAIMKRVTTAVKKRDKIDVTTDARAMMRLKQAAERCKTVLSDETEFLLELPFFYAKKNGEPAGYSEKITRDNFEDMIRNMILSTEIQIKTALSDADLEPEEIDLTLLVGGSSRIPFVQRFLSEIFEFHPEIETDPDLAVVKGAALQAAALSGALGGDAIVLTDICPYSLSVKALDQLTDFTYCDILIKRNSVLPSVVSRVYTTAEDRQDTVHISAYQGESHYPAENILLNSFELTGIPQARAGAEKINIQFEYDLNGILTVSAEILSTGKSATVKVDAAAMGQNLDLSKWQEAQNAHKFRRYIKKAERLAKICGEDDAEDILSLTNELKKSLVMGWEDSISEKLLTNLQMAIEILEEGA